MHRDIHLEPEATLPEGLSPEATAEASDSVDGAMLSANEVHGPLGEQLITAAQEAFTGGLNTAAIVSAAVAAIVSAAVAALAAVIAATGLRHLRPTGQSEDRADDSRQSTSGSPIPPMGIVSK
ncbi:hypothetical protein [Ornithinimicrobium sp. Y1694]|uniref:hypothetical protein n=1 Tax=Ornithinimicrobium sp. Y1694 TaxID=3418590 RepID=UPI003CF7FCCC